MAGHEHGGEMLTVVLRDGTERMMPAGGEGSLMEALRDNGVDEIMALCGGCCSCATCHVILDDESFAALPAMSTDENDLLDSSSHRCSRSRLSCQLSLAAMPTGVRVTIAPEE